MDGPASNKVREAVSLLDNMQSATRLKSLSAQKFHLTDPNQARLKNLLHTFHSWWEEFWFHQTGSEE